MTFANLPTQQCYISNDPPVAIKSGIEHQGLQGVTQADAGPVIKRKKEIKTIALQRIF